MNKRPVAQRTGMVSVGQVEGTDIAKDKDKVGIAAIAIGSAILLAVWWNSRERTY